MATNVDEHCKVALTCTLCQDILTDPRTLPCLHSYCLKCLHGLVEKNGIQDGSFFNCPDCQDVFDVPQHGMRELKVSPTISMLLDAYKDKHQTQEPECTICQDTAGKGTPATIRCLDCNKTFCTPCHKMHDTFFQGHKVHDLTEDGSNDLQKSFQMAKERTIYCKIHPTEPVEYFCKADDTIMCKSCLTIDHSGHPYEDINETAARNVKSMGAVVTQGKELMDMYEEAIRNTKAYKSELQRNTENALAEINNEMNTLVETVKSRYDSLKEQVAQEKQSNVKKVMSHLDQLKLNKAAIEGQVNNYCTIADHGHPVDIPDLAELAIQKSEEWSKQPKVDFNRKINMQFEIGEFSDEALTFGKVLVDNPIVENISEGRTLKPLCEPSIQKVGLCKEYIWELFGTSTGQYVVTGDRSPAAIYDKSFKLIKTLRKDFTSITQTKDENLAFTNQTNTISIHLPDGTPKHDLVCKGLEELMGIAMNSAGEFVVCDTKLKAVYHVDSSTGEVKQQSKPGMFKDPIYVACNSKDVAIISDFKGRFVKGIKIDGTEVFSYEEFSDKKGQFGGPCGVCTDAEDYIFVADRRNHKVHMLDPQGRFMKNVLMEKDGVYYPMAVTIDHNGNLLVGDQNGYLFIVKYRG